MATTTNAPVELMQLQPYIFFYGRCEEALDFYKNVLGGTYEVMHVKDSPMADQMPADFRDKVMHASFTAPGIAFMASDGREAKTVDPDAGNISIALAVTGGLLGVLAATGLVQFIAHSPAAIGVPVHFEVTLPTMLAALVIAASVGVLSAGLPAYTASRVSIVEGMRHIG